MLFQASALLRGGGHAGVWHHGREWEGGGREEAGPTPLAQALCIDKVRGGCHCYSSYTDEEPQTELCGGLPKISLLGSDGVRI